MPSCLSRRLAQSTHSVVFSALRSRCYSQLAPAPSAAHNPSAQALNSNKASTHPPETHVGSTQGATSFKHPYFVPRNSRGSLPVYSDIRNGGTRYLVLVKNVRGNIKALRDDVAVSLFEHGSEEAARLKAETSRNDTLIVTGGRWKHRVMDWLRLKGF